jgi:hypothetical protein
VPLWPGNSLQDIIPLDVHRFDSCNFATRDPAALAAARPPTGGDEARL